MKLPSDILPKRLIKALPKAGFRQTHKVGSHIHFHHPDCRRTQVAMHTKTIPNGTLRAILNQMELTVKQLKKLL